VPVCSVPAYHVSHAGLLSNKALKACLRGRALPSAPFFLSCTAQNMNLNLIIFSVFC